MTTPISIFQLNIEHDRHLNLIIPYLEKTIPDVVCLQEFRQEDISLFEKVLGTKGHFVPMTRYSRNGNNWVMGLAMFSRLPVLKVHSEYYYGDGKNLPASTPESTEPFHRALLYLDIESESNIFRIGSTHFTWTHNGEADDLQRRDLKVLFKILDAAQEIVFNGDFNAPRGREIFNEIAGRFRDNIPEKYKSSIDPTFHSRKDLVYLVDGIFSTPSYKVSDVKMISGLSDHCAIMANISKV